jgi:predicted nucleic acid-binding protein
MHITFISELRKRESTHSTTLSAFPDATLVSLAEEIDVVEIFTLDRRGFGTYRIRGKTAFKIWPE